MKIGVCKETADTRVAAVEETVRAFKKNGHEVFVQAAAGAAANISDENYQQAGATVVPSLKELLATAEVVLKVQPPVAGGDNDEVGQLRSGTVLVATLRPLTDPALAAKLAAAGVTSFSMDMVPRIARAQSMDVLSSMASVAGYKAVLLAANRIGRLMPMMMTAAGTIQPAGVLVIGAGVAGLQAIATARRLGATIKAVDTRPAVKEQVESLGAKFVPLEVDHQQAQDAGGYAKDLGEEFYRQEQEIVAPHLKGCSVVICTAQIPGRKAPVLITEAMVKTMLPGSAIIDIAAPYGGNCSLTKPGQWVEAHGVSIYGPENLPAEMPALSSTLYSRNIATFLNELIKDGKVNLDMNNEVIKGMLITHEGKIVSEATLKALERQGGKP
jgi:NAD(P) transhydrogenase subunit alpha